MKHPKRLWLAGAVVMTACGLTAPADATQLTPTGTEVTFQSTNFLMTAHNGLSFRATSSMTATLPATSSTWVAVPVTLSFSNCTANGALPCTFHVGEGCHTAASQPILHVMGIGSNQAMSTITVPNGCNITQTIPSVGCTLTINGPQTISSDTIGFGGMHLTGGSSATIHLNNTLIRDMIAHGPTSATCATSPTHTASGTITGTYTSNRTVDVDGS